MLEDEKFIRKVFVSWEEMEKQSRLLANAVRDLQPWKGIVAVARAGLIPAAVVAYELNIRLVETICISAYDYQIQREAEILKTVAGDGEDMLVIEDIVDTGSSGQLIKQMLPRCYFATVFAKPRGLKHVDKAMIHIAQDTWVDFPWETPSSFTEKVTG